MVRVIGTRYRFRRVLIIARVRALITIPVFPDRDKKKEGEKKAEGTSGLDK